MQAARREGRLSGPVVVLSERPKEEMDEEEVDQLHEQLENTSGMRGSELSLLVGGAWSSYRSYIVRYLRQMAVITPYARFRLSVMIDFFPISVVTGFLGCIGYKVLKEAIHIAVGNYWYDPSSIGFWRLLGTGFGWF